MCLGQGVHSTETSLVTQTIVSKSNGTAVRLSYHALTDMAQ